MGTIISTLAGVIIGGLITWWLSKRYYKKSADELIKQSDKLKLTSDLILYKLQYPDTPIQLKRNAQGEITGLIVEMTSNK